MKCKGEKLAIKKKVLWTCSWCGAKAMREFTFGKPEPGRCAKKSGDKPHTWVKQSDSAKKKSYNVLWSCTWCGAKEMRNSVFGRPQPGICSRKNGGKPHTWIKQKEFK